MSNKYPIFQLEITDKTLKMTKITFSITMNIYLYSAINFNLIR